MKKTAIVLFLLFLFFSLYSQTRQPSWLSVLPQEKNYLYSVGASSPYFFPETTRAKAFDDACLELARTIEVNVKAKQVHWFEETGSLFSGISHFEEEYEEEVDTSLLNLIRSSAEKVAEWQEPKSKIFYVLVRVPVSAISSDTSLTSDFIFDPALSNLSSAPGKSPKWVFKVPTSDVAIYAVGASDRYFDPVETRRRAIQNARSELARILNAKIQTLFDNWSYGNKVFELGYVMRISRTVSSAKLRGSQIVGFWIDTKTGANYALVRMFKKSFTYQVKQLATNAIKQDPPRNVAVRDKPIEQILNEAIEELDKELEKLNQNRGAKK